MKSAEEGDIAPFLSLDGCWFHCAGCREAREALRASAAESAARRQFRSPLSDLESGGGGAGTSVVVLDLGEIKRAKDDDWEANGNRRRGSVGGALPWSRTEVGTVTGSGKGHAVTGAEAAAHWRSEVAEWSRQRDLLAGPAAHRDLSAVAR